MDDTLIAEFKRKRDAGTLDAGPCQTVLELIAAGLDRDKLREAIARIGEAFREDELLSQSHGRLPENEWWPLRWKILRRDKFTCFYCGHREPPEGGEARRKTTLCADHVVPLSRGGDNSEENLVCACLPCNSSKSDRLLSEWRGRDRYEVPLQ